MDSFVVGEGELRGWLDNLIKQNEVIAPVKQQNFTKFSKVSSVDEIVWNGPQTVIPPKEFMYPQTETLVNYRYQGEEIKVEGENFSKSQILFGVHPCDLNAIYFMDQVWAEKNLDENYLAKRRAVILIGVECLSPCLPEAFCLRMGGLDPKGRFDLFLTNLGKSFLIEVATEKGKKLLEELKKKEAKAADLKKLSAVRKKRDKLFDKKQAKLSPKYKDLPMVMKGNYNSPLWEERGRRCYGCGSCNMVCPTCYCFDVLDYMHINLSEGRRIRTWDGCMLEEFAKVASGENFREDRSQRLRHRTYRKLLYLFEKWGESFCTGCGRCVKACLTKIVSPLEIVNELVKKR